MDRIPSSFFDAFAFFDVCIKLDYKKFTLLDKEGSSKAKLGVEVVH